MARRVVSMLHSVTERGWVQIAAVTVSGNSLRQTVHTHCASVHQAVKLVAALLRVAWVTAGLAEINDSLPQGLWLASPAGWLPRTGISSGTLRSAVEYGLASSAADCWGSVMAGMIVVCVRCCQGFKTHADETDPARVQQIISRALDDAQWVVNKVTGSPWLTGVTSKRVSSELVYN